MLISYLLLDYLAASNYQSLQLTTGERQLLGEQLCTQKIPNCHFFKQLQQNFIYLVLMHLLFFMHNISPFIPPL